MNYLKQLYYHSYFLAIELCRQPMYVVSSILFPSMFFWFFGIPNAKTPDAIIFLTYSFSCFSVLSVVLFQFSVGISQEKETSWYFYLRSLPSYRGIILGSRIISGFIFSSFAVAGVLCTAFIFSDLKLADIDWVLFLIRIFAGAIPFALLGICLGQWVGSKTILPVANLVYLVLSFAGGLWMPPSALPTAVQKISPYLPTRMYGELMWSVASKIPTESRYVYGLGIYAAIFLFLSIWLIKREEQISFS
ncbi:MAG: ABC transporter permease [Moraxellaceae bacterium]|nr:ABC transporter permease [Pseudobdellovibrionaceae bacterium]